MNSGKEPLHFLSVRFPRFHFGTAIALGLSMLCMSVVPVFADGLSAPTLQASVSDSTITLTWNVPGGTHHFMLRRDTVSAPANSSAGTLVLNTADTSTTSYNDTGLANGTYYYSIFGVTAGSLFSSPGTKGPLTVNVVVIESSSSSSSEATVVHSGGGKRGRPGSGGGKAPTLAELHALRLSANSGHAAAPKTDTDSESKTRTCERVMKWFSTDAKMLLRVNERLLKRFGFEC